MRSHGPLLCAFCLCFHFKSYCSMYNKLVLFLQKSWITVFNCIIILNNNRKIKTTASAALTSALCVNHSLRNSLVVKVRYLVEEEEILKERGAPPARRLHVELVSHRAAMAGGQQARLLKSGTGT